MVGGCKELIWKVNFIIVIWVLGRWIYSSCDYLDKIKLVNNVSNNEEGV